MQTKRNIAARAGRWSAQHRKKAIFGWLAFVVIAVGIDPSRTLVISQVVLSFGIPFALVPLIMFTSRRDLMGPLVNRRVTTIVASLVAGVIIALNLFLLTQTFGVT